MCELLVIVTDKTNADPYLDAKCYKRGDVVTVHPDGHIWGSGELINPLFRILKMPGLPVTDALSLVKSEVDVDMNNPSSVLQRRASRLLLDNLPSSVKIALAKGRSNPLVKALLSSAELEGHKIQKPTLSDPNVFT